MIEKNTNEYNSIMYWHGNVYYGDLGIHNYTYIYIYIYIWALGREKKEFRFR